MWFPDIKSKEMRWRSSWIWTTSSCLHAPLCTHTCPNSTLTYIFLPKSKQVGPHTHYSQVASDLPHLFPISTGQPQCMAFQLTSPLRLRLYQKTADPASGATDTPALGNPVRPPALKSESWGKDGIFIYLCFFSEAVWSGVGVREKWRMGISDEGIQRIKIYMTWKDILVYTVYCVLDQKQNTINGLHTRTIL